MQCKQFNMKTATIPPLRVTADFRNDAESVLHDGETLSSFVEEALRKQIEFRKSQKAFIARGLRARDNAKTSGQYTSKREVMDSLRSILNEVKRKQ
jgi:hypothetical protein